MYYTLSSFEHINLSETYRGGGGELWSAHGKGKD